MVFSVYNMFNAQSLVLFKVVNAGHLDTVTGLVTGGRIKCLQLVIQEGERKI